MYLIKIADLYYKQNSDELTWSLMSPDQYPTERKAYERISQEMQEDYGNDCLGRYVYRVIKSGE